MDERLQPQGRSGRNASDDRTLEQMVILYARSLKLLSDCSFYVPESLKDQIEQLAQDSRKAAIPVRVEKSNGIVAIDPYGIPG
jgi:hypothetical protein